MPSILKITTTGNDDYLKKKEGQPHRDQPSQNTNTSSENLKTN